jgi:HK97 family phage major capsid protein
MSDNAKLLEAIEQQGKAFADFKSANDVRLAEIEKKGSADPVTEQKVKTLSDELIKLNAAVETERKFNQELEKKMNRAPFMAGTDGKQLSQDQIEHKSAFNRFLRKGNEEGLRELEKKALQVGNDPDGGYAVPEELDRNILNLLVDENPIRSIANVVAIGGAEYKKLVNKHGSTSGWVGETDARAETSASKLATISPVMGELYAFPMATQTVIDDAFFNIEQWLVDEAILSMATEEGSAMLTGNGVNKPKGLLSNTIVATGDKTRDFGSLQYLPTKGASTFASTNPGSVFMDMVFSLRAAFRQGAYWVMNKATLAEVMKLVDGQGRYLWQPNLQAGQPSSLLGYPVLEMEQLDDIGANKYPVLFGNFKRGFTIVDRMGTRILRDPYTAKPYIGFYMTKRVGSMLEDSSAIKVMKVAAS